MIPAGIQMNALLQGPLASDPDALKPLIATKKIQETRYRNYCSKKYHQYHIFSYEAMKRFAETGHLSDHFWAYRDFTAQETVDILQSLIDRMQISRYLHIFYMKPDVKIAPDELVWYDGSGVSILVPGTSYDLTNAYSEIELKDQGFESFFGNFFMKHFTEEYCETPDQSLNITTQLLAVAKARLMQEQTP